MRVLFIVLIFLVTANSARAFTNGSFGLGGGYFSQNFMSETTSKDSGEKGFMGTSSNLLLLKYDYGFAGDWFVGPSLDYSIFPRDTADGNAKVSILHLVLPFGKNFGDARGNVWDWYAGPGLIRYDIKGAGGTTVMNNGTSTATFARPGGTSSVQKITTNFGASYTFSSNRFGLDFILENLLSQSKRTQSFMLSYNFLFGGGY